MFKYPDQWSLKKKHMISYEILLDQANEKNVHHILLYQCSKQYETEFLTLNSPPKPGPCYIYDPSQPNKWNYVRKYCTQVR
jgi:hypothetical protein